MKVRFRQSGGFAGLVLGCDLDTSTLPPAEAQELTRLVKQANLEKIQTRRSEKARDLQNYEVAVEGDGITAKATFDDMSSSHLLIFHISPHRITLRYLRALSDV